MDATRAGMYALACTHAAPVRLQLPGLVDALSISLAINKFQPSPPSSPRLRAKRYQVQ